jgi:hypothetical protein
MLSTIQRRGLCAMIGLMMVVIVFHLLIVAQVIPYTIVWAGRLNTVDEMYAFEAVSIAINLLLLIVLLLKGGYIKNQLSHRLLNGFLWFFLVVFALNTIGNLTAETVFEKVVFTPITLLSAIFLWVILRKEKS